MEESTVAPAATHGASALNWCKVDRPSSSPSGRIKKEIGNSVHHESSFIIMRPADLSPISYRLRPQPLMSRRISHLTL